MSHFPDLTPHTYTDADELDVRNVGWLDPPNAYPRGETSEAFMKALAELCSHPVRLHRGFHACGFCPAEIAGDLRGNGQIRVQSRAGVWYAAPMLVHHYVSVHAYLPPNEFVQAVLDPAAVESE